MDRSVLLDEALELDARADAIPSPWSLLIIEDCIETSGAFLLYHMVKRFLVQNSSFAVILVAFSQPFSHYDRVLRKMGCNLAIQRDANRFFFVDMPELPVASGGDNDDQGLITLYQKIEDIIKTRLSAEGKRNRFSIVIDDLSLVEIVANGSTNEVLNFMHYCKTLVLEFGHSLIALNHKDIYSSLERPVLCLQMQYLADVIISVEPLASGLASDVHGQLTVFSKCNASMGHKVHNFHFRVKENSVDYFYPGSLA